VVFGLKRKSNTKNNHHVEFSEKLTRVNYDAELKVQIKLGKIWKTCDLQLHMTF
jgi:hypothetical protein